MNTLSAMRPGSTDSALARAAAMTERLFSEADAIPASCEGHNLVWSLYDRVHMEVSLPFQLGKVDGPESGLAGASGGGVAARASWVGEAARHLFPFLFSLVSLGWLRLRRVPCIAIWTGDFYDARADGDFRVGDLYRHLKALDVPFVEFIRANHRGGTLQILKNAWARRRWAIYYDACAFFLASPKGIPPLDLSRLSDPEARAVFVRYERDLARTRSAVGLFRKWFSRLRIRSLVSWEFSSRQAALVVAAKGLGIPVIGFMHGAGMRSYMVHEFIPRRAKNIGPDVFGVWSAWWKEYYDAHAGIYGRIEVSGPMRIPQVRRQEKRARPDGRPLVLWISEPLLDPKEAAPWLRHLRGRYRLVIKKRPSTADAFYNGLTAAFPEFRDLETRDGDIFKAIAEADVVLGSHSTGVIDAALVNVPFLLVATRKWGDYFELASLGEPCRLYVRDTAELDLSLECLLTRDLGAILAEIRGRFYGDGVSDGSRWVAERAGAAFMEDRK